jgi:hypothetical protein
MIEWLSEHLGLLCLSVCGKELKSVRDRLTGARRIRYDWQGDCGNKVWHEESSGVDPVFRRCNAKQFGYGGMQCRNSLID